MCFSGALHLVMIVMLLAVPASTARREPRVPVYTVDLVADVRPAPRPEALPLPEEELEEARLEPAVPEPPAPLKEEKQAKKPPKPKKKEAPPVESVKKAPPEKPKKKVAKPKKTLKPKKVVKRKKPAPPKAAAKKKARKKPAPKSPAKVARKPSKAPEAKRTAGKTPRLVERLRQRRMDDAVATARERARLRREARVGQGTGGGAVRGMEFLVYYNQMLNLIKDRWTWIGKRKDLEVTVGFGVGTDGEIFGLKLLRVSGDVSYDESVVRAVRRVSPLPPPPPSYARDFAEVEVTFRPHDLDG